MRRLLRGQRNGTRLVFAALLIGLATVSAAEEWTVVVGPNALQNAALRAAVDDLHTDGAAFDLTFSLTSSPPDGAQNLLVIGDASRNPSAQRLLPEEVEAPDHPQGFRLATRPTGSGRRLAVFGGSEQGDVHGLYWVWDRMRVHKRIPDLNVVRVPALPIRLCSGTSPAHIRAALRHTATWVSGGSIPDLVPWGVTDVADKNAGHRRDLQKLVGEAHAHGLKYLAVGDEIAYHPAFLEAFEAVPDPADPHLWDAVQEKFRRLFKAMPDLDGVQIRTGELTRIMDPYIAFNVMHDPPDRAWPLEQRYRTFVKKLHEVVVGEFDKIYFHRTWVTNTTEQHSDPAVYKAIFTDDVPTRNLYLSPYLSRGDRWYYQPYNPTFNQTPHTMVVLLSTLDYHAAHGVPVFPSFPGDYHRGGMQQILRGTPTNLRGVHFGLPATEGWDTMSVTAYTVFRLAWDPHEDLRSIAEDHAAIHFGPKAAPALAEILMLSQEAYRDGLYVKPVAEGLSGNTLPHLRLTTFPIQGMPAIDRGRAHIAWLRQTLYEPCLGREDEAVAYLDRGLAAADRMQALYREAAPRIEDTTLRNKVGDSLALTQGLVAANNAYVKACLAYFRFRDDPTASHHAELANAVSTLKQACECFADAPGFCYKLHGIDQLVKNADAALADLPAAEAALERAPDEAGVTQAIAAQQSQYAQALEVHRDAAVHVLHWRGKVDGKDILRVQGDKLEVEHVQADGITGMDYTLSGKLPAEAVTILVKDNGSRDIGPFVLEQPTAANGHTAKIYLFDAPPSCGWFDLDLYYLPQAPAALGLEIPWQD